jgi:Lar family restriction alleviation protein
MPDNLKPCPFCGGNNIEIKRGHNNIFNSSVECKDCGGMMVYYSNLPVDEEWNTRPLEDAKDAEIKRLEAQLAEAGAALAGLGYTSSADDSDSYDSLIPDEYL